jgi:hypothetical protein
MSKLHRADRLALLDSEVFQELEAAEIRKQAQSLSDKIIQSPTAQKAISDGITKALTNSADDTDEGYHEEIKTNLKKLPDHVLYEFYKMFDDEVEARGLDAADYEEEFEAEEEIEDEADEEKEDEEIEEVFAYVKSALTKIAHSAADNNDTEAAYLIERAIGRLK